MRATLRIAVPNPGEEGLVLALEAVGLACGAPPLRGEGRRHVEPQRKVRLPALLHPVFEPAQNLEVEAPSAALVGERCVREAVAQHADTAGQRRLDAALQVVAPRREYQQRLGERVHRLVLTDVRATRVERAGLRVGAIGVGVAGLGNGAAARLRITVAPGAAAVDTGDVLARAVRAVVDRAGQLRALQRADNAGPHTIDAAQAKAFTSASHCMKCRSKSAISAAEDLPFPSDSILAKRLTRLTRCMGSKD